MRIRGKITEEELTEVRKIVRSKWYWPKLIIANWYGTLLLCVVLWATVESFLGISHPNWRAVGIMWLVIAAIFGWSFYRIQKSKAKEFSKLDKIMPDWINLDSRGVKLEGSDGANTFLPWQSFKNWREGQKVFLLAKQDGAFVMLPVAVESQVERESIQQLVASQIATKL